MAELKVSEPAQQDVDDIVSTGLDLFGPLQVARYAHLINEAFRAIANDPRLGHTRSRPRVGTRVFPLKRPGVHASHVVVFTYSAKDDVVLILRVLHERAQLARHL